MRKYEPRDHSRKVEKSEQTYLYFGFAKHVHVNVPVFYIIWIPRRVANNPVRSPIAIVVGANFVFGAFFPWTIHFFFTKEVFWLPLQKMQSINNGITCNNSQKNYNEGRILKHDVAAELRSLSINSLFECFFVGVDVVVVEAWRVFVVIVVVVVPVVTTLLITPRKQPRIVIHY